MNPRGVTVGFTVGVFDMLHEGHTNLLQQCCSHCQHLIVGVTTDWLARIQKGHDRPAESYETRKLAVESFMRGMGKSHKVISIDTLDMTPYLQVVDVWIVGENQRNMRPFDWPGQVRVPETRGISTTMLLSGAYHPGHVEEQEGGGCPVGGVDSRGRLGVPGESGRT